MKLTKFGFGIILLQLVFVMQLTGLFRFPVILFGDLQIVTYLFTLFFIGYILLNLKVFQKIVSRPLVYLWIVLSLLLPLALSLMHLVIGYYPDIFAMYRKLGLRLSQLAIFLGAVIFAYKYGLNHVQKTGFMAVITICIIFAFEYTNPNAFLFLQAFFSDARGDIQYLIDSNWLKTIRASGFYFNPNAASFALTLIFIPVYISKNVNILRVLTLFFIQCVLLILTGSRGALFFIPVALLFLSRMISKQLIKKKFEKFLALSLIPFFVATLGILFLVFITVFSAFAEQNEIISGLVDRLAFFTEGNFDQNIAQDRSLNLRLEAQKEYIGLIGENPLLGYGYYYTTFLRREMDVLSHVSHNWFLEAMFQNGIIYMIFILVFLWSLWVTSRRKNWSNTYNFDAIGYIIATMLFFGLVNSNILEYRFFAVIFGFLVGLLLKKQLT